MSRVSNLSLVLLATKARLLTKYGEFEYVEELTDGTRNTVVRWKDKYHSIVEVNGVVCSIYDVKVHIPPAVRLTTHQITAVSHRYS